MVTAMTTEQQFDLVQERVLHSVNEIGFVLVGRFKDGIWHARMRWRRAGLPASVAIDWKKALEREEEHGDVVGFFHTHPRGCSGPSGRDDLTMEAWCRCFGKRLLCVIDCGTSIGAWVYAGGARQRSPALAKVVRFSNSWIVAVDTFSGGDDGEQMET